jgi:hypothetical protein
VRARADYARLVHAAPVFAICGVAMVSCISTSSGLAESGQGCPEFTSGATFDDSVKVDVRVRGFMQASADLEAVSATVKAAVKTACINIAHDLGAEDTWSSLGDVDDAIHNQSATGACDAANARITAVMESAAGKAANFALVISRGACHADFNEQVSCEAGCETQEKCDPGTVETRCEPGQLSVTCQDACSASSYCEGNASAEANCQGRCEAECHGTCSGTCIDSSGGGAPAGVTGACHGKCIGSCSGTCTGLCQIQASAGVQCGANVKCKGTCSGKYTDPVCETEFGPPNCTIDQNCFDECQTSVSSKTKCDPPTVELIANANAGGDVPKLVATINANLAQLVSVAETQGPLVVKAGQKLVATGEVVFTATGDLDGHSIACATTAAQAASASASTLEASELGGTNVNSACAQHAQ